MTKERLSTIGLHPFDKAFNTQYEEGNRVEFSLDGSFVKIYTGTIRGPATVQDLIKMWIVQFDEPIPGYDYSCAVIQHTFMRLRGSNEPFPNTIPSDIEGSPDV